MMTISGLVSLRVGYNETLAVNPKTIALNSETLALNSETFSDIKKDGITTALIIYT